MRLVRAAVLRMRWPPDAWLSTRCAFGLHVVCVMRSVGAMLADVETNGFIMSRRMLSGKGRRSCGCSILRMRFLNTPGSG